MSASEQIAKLTADVHDLKEIVHALAECLAVEQKSRAHNIDASDRLALMAVLERAQALKENE